MVYSHVGEDGLGQVGFSDAVVPFAQAVSLPNDVREWWQVLRVPPRYEAYLRALAEKQGFYARLYRFLPHQGSGGPIYVLAFRGSDDGVGDWYQNNLPQGAGIIPFQYGLAQQLRWAVEEAFGDSGVQNLTAAGHSLGGGLAVFSSLGASGTVWAFNPARVNLTAIHQLPASLSTLRIGNLRVDGDPVSVATAATGALIGTDILLPYVPSCKEGAERGAAEGGPMNKLVDMLTATHSMDAVLRGMQAAAASGRTDAARLGAEPRPDGFHCFLHGFLNAIVERLSRYASSIVRIIGAFVVVVGAYWVVKNNIGRRGSFKTVGCAMLLLIAAPIVLLSHFSTVLSGPYIKDMLVLALAARAGYLALKVHWLRALLCVALIVALTGYEALRNCMNDRLQPASVQPSVAQCW
jgi:hypothetical protein